MENLPEYIDERTDYAAYEEIIKKNLIPCNSEKSTFVYGISIDPATEPFNSVYFKWHKKNGQIHIIS